MADKEEILSKVKECLADALSVDEEEVTPEASLSGDLGAESLDFLDIIFRLEKAFGIKIQRGDLFPEKILSNAEYVQDGKLTDKGIEKLQEEYPYVDLAGLKENPGVDEMGNLFTVGMIVNYIDSRLN
jgi:acyl carrier protein